MTTSTKITLSAEEQLLVNNSQLILTKRMIIEKAMNLLSQLAESMKPILEAEQAWLPEAAGRSRPRISRGENYRSLPYVILDFPACFEKDNIFAVRTMFWWGNFFSITLHLSGHYKAQCAPGLLNKIELLKGNDYYIAIGDNPWEHHFDEGNYRATNALPEAVIRQAITAQHFIKLAKKYSLEQWNELPDLLAAAFGNLLQLLK